MPKNAEIEPTPRDDDKSPSAKAPEFASPEDVQKALARAKGTLARALFPHLLLHMPCRPTVN